MYKYNIGTGAKTVLYSSPTYNNPQAMAVDFRNGAIYWISYTSQTDTYYMLKTLYNGTTTTVMSFPGPKVNVDLAVGDDYLYFMDSQEKEIQYFDRSNDSLLGSISIENSASQILTVKGK